MSNATQGNVDVLARPLAPSGDGGRDRSTGRFQPGNPGGKGNPDAKRVAALRQALLEAVTPTDIKAVVRAMVDAAKGGDVAAAREVLDRTIGRVPTPAPAATQPENVPRLTYIIN